MGPACQVCGNLKGVFRYYGAEVCGPCKIFFLRAVKNGDNYACTKGGDCEIKSELWTKVCRACRFRRCVEANMDATMVGNSRTRKKKIPPAEPTEQLSPCKVVELKNPYLEVQDLSMEVDLSPPASPGLPDLATVPSTSTTVISTREVSTKTVALKHGRRKRGRPSVADLFIASLNLSLDSVFLASAVGDVYKTFLKTDDHILIVSKLVELENKCYAEDSYFGLDELSANLDISLETAFHDPGKLCNRTPLAWGLVRNRLPSMLDMIKRLYGRMALLYIDWLRSIPELENIDGDDKMRLISYQLAKVSLITMFYHSYKTGSSGMAWSGGYHYAPSENMTGVGHEIDVFMNRLVAYGQEHIISAFRETDITIEEYCLLKMIAFWSGRISLSDSAEAVIKRTKRKYEELFVRHINDKHEDWPIEKRAARVDRLISLQSCFQNMSDFDNTYIQRMVLLDLAGFRSTLTYEVHVRD
ncbi:unnamed protein product, partial [Mesorhabditis spiculigera]